VAITNDPYNMYITEDTDAVLNISAGKIEKVIDDAELWR